MKRKWLASILMLCMLATLVCGGTVMAFALDDSKEAVTIVDVNYTDNYAGFAGAAVSINMGESGGYADWTDLSESHFAYISHIDKTANNVLKYASAQGNYLILNRMKDRQIEVGDVITFKAGMPWGEKELKEDYVCIYNVAGQTLVEYAPTTFAATETTAKLMVGGEKTLSFTTDYSEAPVTYEVADTNTATVAGNGLSAKITAVAEGTTTLTATLYGGKTATVEITVEAAKEVESISVAENAKVTVTQGTAELTAAHLANLGATIHYVGGETSSFTVTKEMLSGLPENFNAVGTHTVTVTHEGKTATFTLEVVEREALTVNNVNFDFAGIMVQVSENSTYHWQTNNGTFTDTTYIEILDSQGTNITSEFTYQRHENYVWAQKPNNAVPEIGTKFTFKAGFVFVNKEIKADATYIYTAPQTQWEIYDSSKHDVTSLKIKNDTSDNVVRVGTAKQIEVEINEGAATTPRFTSSDNTVAAVSATGEVTGVKVGTATITVKAGEKTATFNVEVKPALQVKGLELVTGYTVWVEKGKDFVLPADFTARPVFDDEGKEVYGSAFALSTAQEGGNTVVTGEVDTTAAGAAKADLKVTYNGTQYDIEVTVEVFELADMEIKELAIVEWFGFNFFIQFPNSTYNSTNFTDASLIPDASKFVYTRADGTEVNCGVYNLGGGNIAVLPGFIDGDVSLDNFAEAPYYMEGDKITLQAGLTGYCWTGLNAANDNPAAGTGMIRKECVLRQEVTYLFNGSVWVVYIPYTGMEVSDTLEVTLNQGKSLGAQRVPLEATEGKFEYKVEDESIVSVNANGRVTGKKIGSTTVTVTLTGGEQEFTKTVTVTVVDGVKELRLSVDKIEITKGGNPDLGKIKAQLVYESGKTVDVDVKDAELIGFDSGTVGEQDVTLRIKVDGVNYTAQLTVKVTEEEGCGCGSSAAGYTSLTVGGIAVVLALTAVLIKKKQESK